MKGRFFLLLLIELKCDELEAVLPDGAIIPNSISLKYLDHLSFVFDCETGFIPQGTSESNNTTVTCKENGRWSLNTLTCSGKNLASFIYTVLYVQTF